MKRMDQPKIAGRAPIAFEIEAGKNYAWCACGKSGNQPLCDGSHAGTGLAPHVFKAEESKTVHFCMCKQTGGPPFCDGTHKTLPPEE